MNSVFIDKKSVLYRLRCILLENLFTCFCWAKDIPVAAIFKERRRDKHELITSLFLLSPHFLLKPTDLQGLNCHPSWWNTNLYHKHHPLLWAFCPYLHSLLDIFTRWQKSLLSHNIFFASHDSHSLTVAPEYCHFSMFKTPKWLEKSHSLLALHPNHQDLWSLLFFLFQLLSLYLHSWSNEKAFKWPSHLQLSPSKFAICIVVGFN